MHTCKFRNIVEAIILREVKEADEYFAETIEARAKKFIYNTPKRIITATVLGGNLYFDDIHIKFDYIPKNIPDAAGLYDIESETMYFFGNTVNEIIDNFLFSVYHESLHLYHHRLRKLNGGNDMQSFNKEQEEYNTYSKEFLKYLINDYATNRHKRALTPMDYTDLSIKNNLYTRNPVAIDFEDFIKELTPEDKNKLEQYLRAELPDRLDRVLKRKQAEEKKLHESGPLSPRQEIMEFLGISDPTPEENIMINEFAEQLRKKKEHDFKTSVKIIDRIEKTKRIPGLYPLLDDEKEYYWGKDWKEKVKNTSEYKP